ncbi:MAG: hypothetical protein ACUVRO_10505 [Armatimonadota bacterium]
MAYQVLLPDGSTLALPLPDDAQDVSLQSLESLIDRLTEKGTHTIAVEFECGACCKKVLNGRRLIVIPVLNVLVLLPDCGECLHLKLFCAHKLVEEQEMRAIIINLNNVKAIEIGAEQIDP